MFQPDLVVLGLRQGRWSFTMITGHACFNLSGSGFYSSSATMKKLRNKYTHHYRWINVTSVSV